MSGTYLKKIFRAIRKVTNRIIPPNTGPANKNIVPQKRPYITANSPTNNKDAITRLGSSSNILKLKPYLITSMVLGLPVVSWPK